MFKDSTLFWRKHAQKVLLGGIILFVLNCRLVCVCIVLEVHVWASLFSLKTSLNGACFDFSKLLLYSDVTDYFCG